MFLENCPDERIGYAGRWMNERMTGEKGFAQGTHFVCVGVCVLVLRSKDGLGREGLSLNLPVVRLDSTICRISGM